MQFGEFVAETESWEALVHRAERSIIEDPDVMGGLPVLKGTRVLVTTVVASKRAGFDIGQLREAYPFLTPELVADAETYLQVHSCVEHPLSADGPVPESPSTRMLVSGKRVALPPRQ